MSLLLAEGFDTQTALSTGVWTPGADTLAAGRLVAGRTDGYALSSRGGANTDGVHLGRTITSSTTLIIGFAFRSGVTSSSVGSLCPISLSNAGTQILSIRISESTGALTVNRGTLSVSGTTIGTTSVNVPVDDTTWTYIEMKVVASTGSGGSVVIKQDGAETLNITSQNTGATAYDGIWLRAAACGSGGGDAYGSTHDLDDVYVLNNSGSVNNDFLGDVKVYGLWPNGNGANSGLVGSDSDSTNNYLLVDDAGAGAPDTADYVGSATTSTKDTYTYTDVPTGVSVKGVQVDAYAAKSDAGAISGRNVAFDGTNTITGSDAVLSTSYTMVSMVMETAPDAAAWTAAKVNSAQFGWEVRT